MAKTTTIKGAEFIKMIDGGVFLSVKDLVDLATVCNQRLAKSMS